jgi:hypothetical protein
MTKLPEPAAYRYKFKEDLQWQHTNTSFTIHRNAIAESLFNEAQMLQFRRDALEEAAKLMWKKAGELGIFNHHATKELIGCVTKLKDET